MRAILPILKSFQKRTSFVDAYVMSNLLSTTINRPKPSSHGLTNLKYIKIDNNILERNRIVGVTKSSILHHYLTVNCFSIPHNFPITIKCEDYNIDYYYKILEEIAKENVDEI